MRTSAATRYYDRLKKKRQAIHVARRQLELADETYRALLMRVAGVKSSADLTNEEMANAVLDELARIGFQYKPRITPRRHPGTPHNLAHEPYLRKIEALLADMELPWAYAEKIAENITGGVKPEAIKRLAWVRREDHLRGIVAALFNEKKKRLARTLAELGQGLAARGLTLAWAEEQAEAMGRRAQPWPWYECLETLRLISARLMERA